MATTTPDALFAAARAGDARAWGQIIARYRSTAINAARGAGLSAADAEDAAQETWVRLWRRIDDIDPARVRGWVAIVARNWAISYVRQVGRVYLPGDDLLSDLVQLGGGGGSDPADTIADADEARAALAALPRRQRQVLISRAWLGSVPATAAELGLQEGGVKSITSAGRASLRAWFGPPAAGQNRCSSAAEGAA